MNCQNCGAPMELDQSHENLTCQYCSSSEQFDSEDNLDRIVSSETPTGIICPCCRDEQLVDAKVDNRDVRHCLRCGGILFEAPVFAEVAWSRRRQYRGPDQMPKAIGPDELEYIIKCPSCGEPMDVHPHYGPGRAVIDSCSDCDLVWLDQSELTSIERTPGRRS